MKLFSWREDHGDLARAKAHAADGGQALVVGVPPLRVPERSGPTQYGYLFDQDRARLVRTARIFGVRRVKVDKPGKPGQHVNLWGSPLVAALEVALEEGRLAPDRAGRSSSQTTA